MDITQIQQHAQQLYDAHGDKAEAEAAQKAAQCETSGDQDQAENWRKIRIAIHQMRGPGVS
jgi:hypothetical protein